MAYFMRCAAPPALPHTPAFSTLLCARLQIGAEHHGQQPGMLLHTGSPLPGRLISYACLAAPSLLPPVPPPHALLPTNYCYNPRLPRRLRSSLSSASPTPALNAAGYRRILRPCSVCQRPQHYLLPLFLPHTRLTLNIAPPTTMTGTIFDRSADDDLAFPSRGFPVHLPAAVFHLHMHGFGSSAVSVLAHSNRCCLYTPRRATCQRDWRATLSAHTRRLALPSLGLRTGAIFP